MMDYKKAYYSLIERLKEAKEDADICDERYCCVIDGLIQEPEESERIRKAISQCVEDMRGQFEKLYRVHHKDAIAWLEKQGNKPKQTSIWKHWKDGIAGNGEGEPIYLVKNGNTYSLNSCLGCECDYIELSELDKLMLEKQGIKPKKETPAIKKCREHKFGKGNWIVGHNVVCRILSIYIGGYIVDKDGCELFIPFEDEELYHLWNIQDAKDGDVLFSPNHNKLWIYMDKEQYHAAINLNYANFVSFGADIVIPSDVQPATEKQRELLFLKMEEAGYVFDFENKQLRKIEQKPDSFCKEHCRGFKETGKCYADGSCDAKIKAEQNSSWTEEDERNLQNIDSVLFREISLSEDECMRLRDWLQSIKQRATWKPTEEQIQALNEAVGIVGLFTPRGSYLKSLSEQLKRLIYKPKEG